jgi:serine/threonine protein kinase
MIQNATTSILINNKYIIESNIGKGQFGSVYKGYHKKTREPVAIKLEKMISPIKLLKNETTILNYLQSTSSRNIPEVHWFGVFANSTCLVMTLYDYSLYDCIKSKELSIEQIQKIMIKSIDIVENIHNSFVLHRDIKPQNFMIKNSELFIIDFGFSTFYIDDNKNHLPIKTNDIENCNIIGTPKYTSINIHNGITPSRRDDLISLGYIFILLLYKQLPWDVFPIFENNNNYDEIHILNPKNQYMKQLKQIESIDNLKKTDNILSLYVYHFINYCYSLKYDEDPNYYSIKQLIMKTI